MSKELKQKAIQKYKEHLKDPNYYENSEEESYYTGFIDGYNKAKEELQELKNLVEKYRQAVDRCLHITFMGGGCEVHTIGQYATLVDGYLTDVEGLAKWKD